MCSIQGYCVRVCPSLAIFSSIGALLVFRIFNVYVLGLLYLWTLIPGFDALCCTLVCPSSSRLSPCRLHRNVVVVVLRLWWHVWPVEQESQSPCRFPAWETNINLQTRSLSYPSSSLSRHHYHIHHHQCSLHNTSLKNTENQIQSSAFSR